MNLEASIRYRCRCSTSSQHISEPPSGTGAVVMLQWTISGKEDSWRQDVLHSQASSVTYQCVPAHSALNKCFYEVHQLVSYLTKWLRSVDLRLVTFPSSCLSLPVPGCLCSPVSVPLRLFPDCWLLTVCFCLPVSSYPATCDLLP